MLYKMSMQSITSTYSEFGVSRETAKGDEMKVWYPFGLEGFITETEAHL